MFGSKKRKAVEVAVAAIRPTLNLMNMTGGIPSGFWQDSYVLGYVFGAAGIFAKVATDGSIKGGEMGEALTQAMSQLSGLDPNEIGRDVVDLLHSKDADFIAGVTAANKVISVARGLKDLDHEPDVIEARLAVSDPAFPNFGGTPNAEASAYLQMKLFHEVVNQRLRR